VKQYIKRVDAEEAADLLVNQAAKLMADGLDVSESTILDSNSMGRGKTSRRREFGDDSTLEPHLAFDPFEAMLMRKITRDEINRVNSATSGVPFSSVDQENESSKTKKLVSYYFNKEFYDTSAVPSSRNYIATSTLV
jgi:hypothetical protein